uniref:Uncharacterized protein n=1 Tax=Rhizophora mucronata TaxID=61149 RepID=A0A2P2QWU0_RHIMU
MIGLTPFLCDLQKAEDFTEVPQWVPFESNIAYRLHEVTKYTAKTEEDGSGISDQVASGLQLQKVMLWLLGARRSLNQSGSTSYRSCTRNRSFLSVICLQK